MTREQYQALPGWNQSTLKKWIELRDCPREWLFWWNKTRHEPDKSVARLLGRGLDCIQLDPGEFTNRFVVIPSHINKRTKDGREEWEAWKKDNAGKEWLTPEQRGIITSMHLALNAEDSVADVLATCGKAVIQSMLWGFESKAELDFFDDYRTEHLWDLKAMDDVSQPAFEKDFFKFGYNYQAVWYLDLASVLGAPKTVFNFICVKNCEPYTVQVHSFAPSQVMEHDHVARWTRRELHEAVSQLDDRFKKGAFANDPDWRFLNMPRWALMK